MRYDVVQRSLEEYFKTHWTYSVIQFDNAAINTELYTEYVRHNVLFAQGLSRTVTRGCYRQPGILMISVFTKPAIGTARQLTLATLAADMYVSLQVNPVAPLVAPKVKFKVPELFHNNRESLGWVMAQVSTPFYYDFTKE